MKKTTEPVLPSPPAVLIPISPKSRCLSFEQMASLQNYIKTGATLLDIRLPVGEICQETVRLGGGHLNGYLRLVEASENNRRGARVMADMGSFFYSKYLLEHTERKDKHWADRWYRERVKDDGPTIEQFHFVLHLGDDHWALAVLHPRLKELRVYDTFPMNKKEVQKHLLGMLSEVNSWKDLGSVKITWVRVPRQTGKTECGLFVCEMMRLAAR
ncbi:hypothetical protein BDD12DRAFT_867367 [Trichophaea hybrida]|nr:hypothetical protein BDD12DRAFT_867367 [Trichophaea hybrida]